MRSSIPLRAAALSLMVVCGATVLVWNRSRVHAAIPPVGMVAAAATQAGGAEEEEVVPDVPKIYVRIPYSSEEISAYQKLQKKIDMPFAQETPLGDVLKYVVEQLNPADKDGKPLDDAAPLQFYVNPRGLQENEKTIDSPVTLDLKQIRAATALEFCLDQLDLKYRVRSDGIIEIDSEFSKRSEQQDPMLLLLNEIHFLRAEITQMRSRQGGMGGMGRKIGGMGGGETAAPNAGGML